MFTSCPQTHTQSLIHSQHVCTSNLTNRHEFEQTQGDGEGQESLACCSPWGRKESYKTERLKNNSKSDEPFKRGSEESLLAFLKKKKFIYLAISGCSCDMQTLSQGMWDLVPRPGKEPRPLYWEHRVSATGPPGKSRWWPLRIKSSWVLKRQEKEFSE